jgi:4-hydroxy-tetrahydrodipicolinate synthase
MGVSDLQMPLTPARLWQAMQHARKGTAVKYRKSEAKDYAKEHMRGIWAAALNPFRRRVLRRGGPALQHPPLDRRPGHRRALHRGQAGRVLLDDAGGAQTQFRDRGGGMRRERAGTIMSASDQNFATVVDLARHAQDIGADYIVVHAPMLHFVTDPDDTVFNYYKLLCDEVDIGIAMWSHPDSGYLMSPELCARVAELPNIVAIKYSVPREMYVRLTELAGDRIQVSTASEAEWLDNIEELGWNLYLCSSPPYQLQTKADQRMNEYTRLAFEGRFRRGAGACATASSPCARRSGTTKPGGKPQAHGKYWQDLLGQVGGPVRAPLLQLTEEEKRATRAAFESCGLKL